MSDANGAAMANLLSALDSAMLNGGPHVLCQIRSSSACLLWHHDCRSDDLHMREMWMQICIAATSSLCCIWEVSAVQPAH